MMSSAFFHGFILALGLILPLGVQNVFVLSQGSIQPKFYRVLPVIITASLSDTLLISIAILGVSVIVLTISWVKIALVGVGVVFLAYMGWMTWKSTGELVKPIKNRCGQLNDRLYLRCLLPY